MISRYAVLPHNHFISLVPSAQEKYFVCIGSCNFDRVKDQKIWVTVSQKLVA